MRKYILILDNYDSFTYNLVMIIRELGFDGAFVVYRNDKIALEDVDAYDKIILSPGPGIPVEAGIMNALIERYAASKSILGICLGHQGIAEVFGAKLLNLKNVLHGIANKILITEQSDSIFRGIPSTFTAGHYHSWVVDKSTVNQQLEIIAMDELGLVMGVRHKQYDIRGL